LLTGKDQAGQTLACASMMAALTRVLWEGKTIAFATTLCPISTQTDAAADTAIFDGTMEDDQGTSSAMHLVPNATAIPTAC